MAVLDGDEGGEVQVDLRPRSKGLEVRHYDAERRLTRQLYLAQADRRLAILQTLHRRFAPQSGPLVGGSIAISQVDGAASGWLLDVERGEASFRTGVRRDELPVALRYPDGLEPEALWPVADLDVDLAELLDESPPLHPPGPERIADRLPAAEVPPLPPISTVPKPIVPVFPWLWAFGADDDLTDELIEAFPDEAAATSVLVGLVEPELFAWVDDAPGDPRAQAAATAVQRLLLA